MPSQRALRLTLAAVAPVAVATLVAGAARSLTGHTFGEENADDTWTHVFHVTIDRR